MDLRLKEPTNAKEGSGGVNVQFDYDIRNTGAYLSENVTVDLLGEPVNWTHLLAASTRLGVRTSTDVLRLTLQRDEVAPLQVMVTPPVGVADGIYGMAVRVRVDNDPSINMSSDIYVLVGRHAAFDLHPYVKAPFDRDSAVPPATVTLVYELFNEGTVEDRYLIERESLLEEAGWALVIVDGTDGQGWTPIMPPDPGRMMPHYVKMNLTVPADAKAGVKCRVTVNATSLFSRLRGPSTTTDVEALQYFGFNVTIVGKERKVCEAGQQAEFQLDVHNGGNGEDTFTIVPEFDPELNPGFMASVYPQTVAVPSDGTVLVSYTIPVPRTAPKKIYYFTAVVSSSDKGLQTKSLVFEVEVPQFYGISLSSPEPSKTTALGGILDFEVDVRNSGNGLDSMTIQVLGVPSGWLIYIQPPEVSLLQNEQSKVSIRVLVPSRFEEVPMGSYNLTVKADSSRSNAEAIYEIQLLISPFYRIEWMYQDLPITDPTAPIAQPGIIKPRREVNPYGRNFFDITLELKNYGNAEDRVSLRGVGLDPRVKVTLSPEWVIIQRALTKLIKVHVEVSVDIPPGEYSLFVNATSQDPSSPTRVVPMAFLVYNLDASFATIPTCHSQDLSGATVNTTVVHDLVVFWLDVANNGSKPLTSVQVKAYDIYLKDGKTVKWNFFNSTAFDVQPGETFEFSKGVVGGKPGRTIIWSAEVLGAHSFEFRILCANQSNVSNDVALLEVSVSKAPPPEEASLVPLVLAVGLALLVTAMVIGAVLIVRRRGAMVPQREVEVEPAAFVRTLPPFEPEPDRVAMMPPPTREHVELYGQDLDGEEVDQVIEKEADLDEDEVGP